MSGSCTGFAIIAAAPPHLPAHVLSAHSSCPARSASAGFFIFSCVDPSTRSDQPGNTRGQFQNVQVEPGGSHRDDARTAVCREACGGAHDWFGLSDGTCPGSQVPASCKRCRAGHTHSQCARWNDLWLGAGERHRDRVAGRTECHAGCIRRQTTCKERQAGRYQCCRSAPRGAEQDRRTLTQVRRAHGARAVGARTGMEARLNAAMAAGPALVRDDWRRPFFSLGTPSWTSRWN